MIEKKKKNKKGSEFHKSKIKKKNCNGKFHINNAYNTFKKSKKVLKDNKKYKGFKNNKTGCDQKLINEKYFKRKYDKGNGEHGTGVQDDCENAQEKNILSADESLKYEDSNDGNVDSCIGSNLKSNKEKTNHDPKQKDAQVDYVDYINMIKKCDENNSKETKKEENKSLNNDKVFNIFLVFSPIAITSVRNKPCLINADDHMTYLENKSKDLKNSIKMESNDHIKKKLEKNLQSIKNKLDNIRSDILFFTLLSLRDSILNKKKKLQIYIHTINNLLIYVSPLFRVPRNFSLFKKVMLNLFKNGVVQDDSKQTLLKILPLSIKKYIGNSICIGISNNGFPTDIKKFADKVNSTNSNYSFFLSLSSTYDVTQFIEIAKRNQLKEFSYDYLIRLSDLKLSAIITCSKLTHFLNQS